MKKILISMLILIASCETFAQINQTKEIQTSQKFGEYTVHYNVFNSKDIPPEVASIYKLTRSKDITLVNISLTKTDNGMTSLGLPAKVSAKAVNLMQQSKPLEFNEIKDPEATYYIASFRHTNEEDIRFEVNVLPEGAGKPFAVSFTRKLFTEN